ncbi:MAG: hypothetical protein MAG794_01034 [Gammaproteobacteria bacterium]|nr:hypothetical protein [Gammaproteobacteria bacterium]
MRRGFHCPPIIAGGQGDGVDTVHDALVVGGRPIRIDSREIAGNDDAVPHLFAVEPFTVQLFHWYLAPGPHQGPIGKVG